VIIERNAKDRGAAERMRTRMEELLINVERRNK
jgi:hypothetical protein